MQKVLLSVLFLFCFFLGFSQWTQTNGPEGGNLSEIVQVGNDLVLSAGNGGIYRSADNGSSWVASNSGIPLNNGVTELVEDNGILYVAISSNGIFKSADAGLNWIPINNGIEYETFYSLHAEGSYIYAGNANGGISYSHDGGTTWNYYGKELAEISFQDFEVLNGKVYAAGGSYEDSSGPLFESSDFGATWQEINVSGVGPNPFRTLLAAEGVFYAGVVGELFISYDNLITWVKAPINTHASIVSIRNFDGNIYVNASNGNYYYSRDAGLNWELVINADSDSFIWDIFVLPTKIITTTSEGIYESSDSGTSWMFNSKGLRASIINRLYANDSYLFAGAQNGIHRSSDNGSSWELISEGFEPFSGGILRIIEVDNVLFIANYDGIYASSDNGNTWDRKLDPGINRSTDILAYDNGNFITAHGKSIFLSNDNAENWSELDIDILDQETSFSSIALVGNTIIMGTHDGELILSQDLGNTWSNISISEQFTFTYDLELIGAKIYAATYYGLYISNDLGQNWQTINDEYFAVRDIILESNIIYAATNKGFKFTTENHNEWFSINEGIGERGLNEIVLSGDHIFAGTYGSSVWKLLKSEVQLPQYGEGFVTKWKTDNDGVSNDNQITIPTHPDESYDYTVDWGDGSSDSGITNNITHTYEIPGTYTVTILGNFPRIYFNDTSFGAENGDDEKIVSIQQWGDNSWSSMEHAFSGCSNLKLNAIDSPNLLNVSNGDYMFYGCRNLQGNPTIGNWDVSQITTMHYMFGITRFNQDLSNWNVENVLNFSYMFYSTAFNQDIDSWNVGNATNMTGMFRYSEIDYNISNWDVSNVISMNEMFNGTPFNQNISNWDVGNVVNMDRMFYYSQFDKDIGNWNVSNVSDMTSIFDESDLTIEIYDKIILGWSELPDLQNEVAFGANDTQYCLSEIARQNLITNFGWTINDSGKNCDERTPFVTTWKTDNLGSSNDNQITIPTRSYESYNYTVDWGDGSSDSDITGDFTHTYAEPGIYTISITGKFPGIYFSSTYSTNKDHEKIISIDKWGNNRWALMNRAFSNCINLDMKATDIPDFSRGLDLNLMFYGCSSLIGNSTMNLWDMSAIISTGSMFAGATLFNQPLNNWDMRESFSMYEMFQNATAFDQDLGNWNIANVYSMDNMFEGTKLSIENYDKTLIGWASFSTLRNDVNFHAGNSQYCLGEEARQKLIDDFGWTITDTGKAEDCTPDPLSITKITLINADSDEPLFDLEEGMTINIDDLPTLNLTIDVQATEDVESLQLELLGAKSHIMTENNALYALYGNSGTDYHGSIFETGSYTFSATPYSDNRLGGEMGLIKTLNFEIVEGDPKPFITTWSTDNPGTSEDNQITIPTFPGEMYNYSVDWGDGNTESGFAGNATHTYVTAGTYQVSISGEFPRIYFNRTGDRQKLLKIDQWGSQQWVSMENAFNRCSNMDLVATDIPNFSEITSTRSMFDFCSSLSGNDSMNNWDMGNITDMSYMFSTTEFFNQDIGKWDTSNATNMNSMFRQASDFNQDIGNWNVSNVRDMASMFENADNFNQDIGNWDVSNVTNMNTMFGEAWDFNQDIGNWNVSKVGDMAFMFVEAYSFNQPIDDWNVSNVTDMAYMFLSTPFNQDIRNWNVSNVTNMNGMFGDASSFDQDLGNWDVSKLSNAEGMFNRTALSTDNYDQILIGWNSLNSLQNGVYFGASETEYCQGEAARQKLIDDFGWTITDAGKATNCAPPPFSVSKVTLINADTDQPLFELEQGMSINIDDLPTLNLTIDVQATDDVESLKLELSGAKSHTMTENNALYALYGNSGTDYHGSTFALGSYTFTATPYSENQLGGVMGDIKTLNFEIIEGEPKPFVTTWKTDNPGTSDDNQITIPTFPPAFPTLPGVIYDYNYSVDWGDGSSSTNITGNITHTYDFPGTYQVSISGVFPRIYFNNGGDREKLLLIEQWGDNEWSSMANAFKWCSNMDVIATDIPNLTLVKDTSSMFSRCESVVGNEEFANWQVGNVVNMRSMFASTDLFNQPIASWDTGNVINVESMFHGADSFNQPIGEWNMSNVTDMRFMFAFAESFNQPVGNWDVSKVVDMTGVFNLAPAFNQPIGDWDVSNVTIMWDMFSFATSFNQDLSNWDVSNVTDMIGIFRDVFSLNQDFGNWDVSSATLMKDMFRGVELSPENYDSLLNSWSAQQLQNGVTFDGGLSQYCLGKEARQKLIDNFGWTLTDGGKTADCPEPRPFVTTWKTDNPGTSEDNQITIPTFPGETYDYSINWGDGNSDNNVAGNITHTYETAGTYQVSISGEFPRIYFDNPDYRQFIGDELKLLTVEQWGDVAWSSMERAFAGCRNMDITAIDIPNLELVTNAAEMFYLCTSMVGNASFDTWQIGSIENMSYMFFSTIFNQNINSWDVSNVNRMDWMFADALFNQFIGDWDVSSVITLEGMFDYAVNFNQDIGNWDVSNVTNLSAMFNSFTVFDQDLSQWNVANVTNAEFMFWSEGLSNENYDKILIGWSQLPELQIGVEFGAIYNQFCLSETARQKLIDDFGWTITDGGKASFCAPAPLSITEITLIDADTDQSLFDLEDGMLINLNDLPTLNLTIDVQATDDVESLQLMLSGTKSHTTTENNALYALYGNSGTDYHGSTFMSGIYTFTVTPYSGNRLSGEMGNPLSVTFEIVDELESNSLKISPNQATTLTKASFEKPTEIKQILVFDISGRLIETYNPEYIRSGDDYILDVNFYQQGTYIVKAIDNRGVPYQKQMIIKR